VRSWKSRFNGERGRFTGTQTFGIVTAAVLTTAAVVGGGFALATPTPSPNTYFACAKDGKVIPGSVKVNTQPKCAGGQTVVSWNEQGVPGATGPTGATGEAGATAGRLIYVNSVGFQGPWDGSTKASFTVPAGTMCVEGAASAYTATAGSQISVRYSTGTGIDYLLHVIANEANSHKTLVPQGLATGSHCKSVAAGTYDFSAQDNGIFTTSDNNDRGSIAVYVYS
jgi:hypothetical protein